MLWGRREAVRLPGHTGCDSHDTRVFIYQDLKVKDVFLDPELF